MKYVTLTVMALWISFSVDAKTDIESNLELLKKNEENSKENFEQYKRNLEIVRQNEQEAIKAEKDLAKKRGNFRKMTRTLKRIKWHWIK
ncbi:MAG: hypothetical protein IPJ71_08105 [Bdellovibrionales bacterium]|nr:hypothetical protein [Bdellovibrionales bacterium]